MRLLAVTLVIAALTIGALPPAATAQTPEPTAASSTPPASSPFRVGGEAAVVSAYVWRGFVESDVPCFQPDAWVALGPVSLDGWMNLEIASDGYHVAEYDLSLLYTREWSAFSVTGGLTNYFFSTEDGGRERHSELALSVAGGGWLNPAVEAYYSVSTEKGAHVTTSVSHPFRLASNLVLTTEAALGYNHRMWIERSGFTDVRGTVKVSLYSASERVHIDTGIDYTHALMRSLFSNKLVWVIGVYAD
jgi:hypothetical protein